MIVFTTPRQHLVWTEDFHTFSNAVPIRVRRQDGAIFQQPAGSKTDLASTPPILWGPPENLPPFGSYARSADVHDGCYQNTLQRLLSDASQDLLDKAKALRESAIELLNEADEIERVCWAKAELNKEQSDFMFLDCLMADGVDVDVRDKLYNGVKFLGWRAFRDDRNL